ncbi:hypothetical protein [Gordonia sp. SL306]|uniref:hypothetical protein n=1 Tax=Gordonia sp. SL306 TaxID=2995145 RepID=UPI00226ECEC4|nr:hypothetical protein [Gordonia sp. SL306]WAC54269.1 hypothetical protein OVA31_16450 [Gordonia sp. SL306]
MSTRKPRKSDRLESGEISLMSTMLAGLPKLPGARCTTRPDLFDPKAHDEDARHCSGATTPLQLCASAAPHWPPAAPGHGLSLPRSAGT